MEEGKLPSSHEEVDPQVVSPEPPPPHVEEAQLPLCNADWTNPGSGPRSPSTTIQEVNLRGRGQG